MKIEKYVRWYRSLPPPLKKKLRSTITGGGSRVKPDSITPKYRDIFRQGLEKGLLKEVKKGFVKPVGLVPYHVTWIDKVVSTVADEKSGVVLAHDDSTLKIVYSALSEGRDVISLNGETDERIKRVLPFLRFYFKGRKVKFSNGKEVELDGAPVKLLDPVLYSVGSRKGVISYFIPYVDQEGNMHGEESGDAVLIKIITRGEWVSVACGTCSTLDGGSFFLTADKDWACPHIKMVLPLLRKVNSAVASLEIEMGLEIEEIEKVEKEEEIETEEEEKEDLMEGSAGAEIETKVIRREEEEGEGRRVIYVIQVPPILLQRDKSEGKVEKPVNQKLTSRKERQKRKKKVKWDVKAIYKGIEIYGKFVEGGTKMIVYDPYPWVGVGKVDITKWYCETDKSHGCIHVKEAMFLINFLKERKGREKEEKGVLG